MATASEDWIQQSLARLEGLEQQRERHEAALETVSHPNALRQHSEAIERLDEEIRGLYAALEAVAGDEGVNDDSDGASVSTHEFQRNGSTELDDYNPFGGAPVAASNEVPSPAAAAFAPSPFDAAPSFDTSSSFEDEPSQGGGMKWIAIAAVVLGVGGIGGYLLTSKSPEPAPAVAQDAGPAQVISASDVPPDTQGPNVAKGGDATVTQGTKVQKSSRGGGGGGGGGAARPRSQESGEKSGHGIKVDDSRDPLAGLK